MYKLQTDKNMNLKKLKKLSDYKWRIDPFGRMRVPAVIYGDEALLTAMDEKVYDQTVNVASLPGIVEASYAMPDAHWGYGFPIGGVAAFDADDNGVISAGGVGFDIACGVRSLTTSLNIEAIEPVKQRLAEMLAKKIPAGLGSTGKLRLNPREMDNMLAGGARWAVENGYGTQDDLKYIEENGCMNGARPQCVSDHAKKRQKDEVGTRGSGNHYLEIQHVVEIFDEKIARAYGLKPGDIVVSIHCGSRGLGHQIGTEFLKKMVTAAAGFGIDLAERELACAPLNSKLGRQYLGAARAAVNCAMANRQVLTHLTRQVFSILNTNMSLKTNSDLWQDSSTVGTIMTATMCMMIRPLILTMTFLEAHGMALNCSLQNS